MRLCVIGDSHVAAMKQGWSEIAPRFPEIIVTFFAAAKDGLQHLSVTDGTITSSNESLLWQLQRTSGGLRVVTGDYDAYLVCGLGLNIRGLWRIFREYMIARNRGTVDRSETTARIYEVIQSVVMGKVLADLRTITAAPIAVIAMPFPPDKGDTPFFTKMKEAGADGEAAEMFNSAAHALAAVHQAKFLAQPTATIGDTKMTTRYELHASPLRLYPGENSKDQSHMNAEYGAIIMAEALETIRVKP